MHVLVTGGAGYIGSHTVAELLVRKHDVTIVDNLSKGHRKAVFGGELCVGDIRDTDFLRGVFKKHSFDAVIHFAADSQVGESMKNPLKYYNNNLIGGITLLNCMKEFKVDKIVFSSTAATYGEPENIPIQETDNTKPTNPYGETKLSFEKCLKWIDKSHGIKHVALRYFNASGAHPSYDIGEDHSPETHLIPITLQVAQGLRESIAVFGNNYPTKDGTCVRDYIHVTDLANAHLLALEKLQDGMLSNVFNLGNGEGFSVSEVIDKARKVTGSPISAKAASPRDGDPAILIASSEKARRELGWKPQHADLETIISTAWKWHKQHPRGYEDQ